MDNLTAFIGKNDVGKSSILKAIEIFFNNSTVKIEQKDACVFGDSQNVRIGCIFSNIPNELLILQLKQI